MRISFTFNGLTASLIDDNGEPIASIATEDVSVTLDADKLSVAFAKIAEQQLATMFPADTSVDIKAGSFDM
jgi:hypothetical protein